jgi:type II secretion system protein N
VGAPLAGLASGTIDVTLAEKPEGPEGTVELRIERFEIGDGKGKVKVPGMAGGLTLDKVQAGTLEMKVTIREGVATVEKLESKGKDLELSGSGSVRVLRPFGTSRADLTLGMKFDPGYAEKSERTKAAFELLSLNPLTKRATGADGMMRFRLSGPLSALRSAPAAPGRAAAKPRRSRKAEPEAE